jgi:hypothetical protein
MKDETEKYILQQLDDPKAQILKQKHENPERKVISALFPQ